MGNVADGVWQGRCWYADEGIASESTFRVERGAAPPRAPLSLPRPEVLKDTARQLAFEA